jgi:circadian clock protein KaiB
MAKKAPNKKTVKAEAEGAENEKYVFQLFVTGTLPNSALAIININSICEKYLHGRYELEVIDIYQQPGLALKEGIIAIPVLIKKFPLPEERLIGDLSDIKRVFKGLRLRGEFNNKAHDEND